MSHRPVHAANLPKPVGPYSPGMGFERLVFVSGQGATDPATGKIVSSEIAAQTEQCLRNVEAILEAAGSSLQHVLRCGVFLIEMGEFQLMNAVYSRMFAPDLGVAEDPATGGASGPLGCYLVAHDLVPASGWRDMVSLQGVKMGRQSRIHMRITASSPTEITRVQVGGQAVRVGSGRLEGEEL